MLLALTLALQGGTTLGEVRLLVPDALRPPAVPSPAQNGWSLALKAAGRSSRHPTAHDELPEANPQGRAVSELLRKWQVPDARDIPAAKRAVAPYAKRIEYLRAALDRPVWATARRSNVTRPTLGPAHTDFEANAAHKELAKALCLRAFIHALEGKGAGAVNDLALARRLGSRLAAGRMPLMPYMVGVSVEAIADAAALRLAAMKTMGPKELAALQRVVETKPDPNRLANAYRVEFDDYVLTFAAAVPNDPRSIMPPTWAPALVGLPLFDRKDTVRRLSEPFITAIGNRNRSWSKQADVQAYSKREAPEPPVGNGRLSTDEVRRLREWLTKHPNHLGRDIAKTVASYAGSGEEMERKALARQRLTAAAIAVERFRRVSGKHALTLRDVLGLSVPADPFGAGPIRYNSKLGRLWSVGPDGRDDGGKGKPNGVKPDLVVEVPSRANLVKEATPRLPSGGGPGN